MNQADITQTIDMAVHSALNDNLFIGGAITTTILIAMIIGLRFFLGRMIKGKSEILDKDQRRWINRINNGTTALVLISLVFVWAPQIHTFALSLTAVAVAVVLITKELLMCLTGGFLRATTKPFDIGDWITIDSVSGEVMRITAMTTLIEEIDMEGKTYQFTGKTVQIPNSRFLSVNVENANFLKNHIYHDVSITVQYSDFNPDTVMKALERITEKYFEPFREQAVKYNKKVEKKAAVDFADPAPQYFLRTTDIGHNVFTVRFFVPTEQAAQLGAQITREFLSYVHKSKPKTDKK